MYGRRKDSNVTKEIKRKGSSYRVKIETATKKKASPLLIDKLAVLGRNCAEGSNFIYSGNPVFNRRIGLILEKKRGFFPWSVYERSRNVLPQPRKHALISAYDGYVSRSETPTRPHSAPSTPIVRLIYVFSRVIRPHLWPTLVEGGRSPWRRRAFRRPIVGRRRCRRQPYEAVERR